jgi:hypothetical protein
MSGCIPASGTSCFRSLPSTAARFTLCTLRGSLLSAARKSSLLQALFLCGHAQIAHDVQFRHLLLASTAAKEDHLESAGFSAPLHLSALFASSCTHTARSRYPCIARRILATCIVQKTRTQLFHFQPERVSEKKIEKKGTLWRCEWNNGWPNERTM